jgi:hypothetical protein
MKEYIIWGVPPKQTSETILVCEKANLKSMQHANDTVKLLTDKHDCKDCRVQIIDLSEPFVWDSRAMLNL